MSSLPLFPPPAPLVQLLPIEYVQIGHALLEGTGGKGANVGQEAPIRAGTQPTLFVHWYIACCSTPNPRISAGHQPEPRGRNLNLMVGAYIWPHS